MFNMFTYSQLLVEELIAIKTKNAPLKAKYYISRSDLFDILESKFLQFLI